MKALWEGLIKKNPVFVLALGLVPAVAITTTAANGLALGLITAVVLLVASMINYVLVPIMPRNNRMVLRGLILIVIVVVLYNILLGTNPSLVASLGIFLPLIAVSSLVLQDSEAKSSFNQVVLGDLGQGLGSTLALIVIGVIREFLGLGSIFGKQIVTGALPPMSLANSVPGGLIIVGLLLALVNKVSKQGGELHD